MRTMVLAKPRAPLEARRLDAPPPPGPHQVALQVSACGVCRTDLHVIDGDLAHPKLPLVPGHEVVGRVSAVGAGVSRFHEGDRVGVPWLGWTCGECAFCRSGRENLCDRARFTGYDFDGGYAESMVADERYAFPIPGEYGDVEAAPLLCAGLIGYRALRLAGTGTRLGFYGFGVAAHIAAQVATARGQEVYAFTRPGDRATQEYARGFGAVWAGGSDEMPPEPLDAAILYAPVGALVPAALRATAKGGRVVSAGIHMSDIPSFPYAILWGERSVGSVANLTRADAEEFFTFAERHRLRTVTTRFALEEANRALDEFRSGRLEGGAVLVP